MSLDSIVIGIDLGTTNSCASYYIDGQLKILENKEGGRTTPSFVFFTEKNPPVIVGQYAKNMADRKTERGIYEMKRLLGREFQDKRVQEKLKYYPFSIREINGKTAVVVEVGNELVTKTPVELSALVLKKIKADVAVRLDSDITKAVITVPAYFNSLQRKETLEAATQAGFTVLKLLNEPNAAALNYYHENQNHGEHVLVYDLGGGTFDVSILKKSGSNVEVLCVDGDSHLGGNDFDDIIVKFVCDELLKNHDIDVTQNDKRQLMRLNTKCEEAKRMLSVIDETDVCLEAFVKGHDRVSIPLSREQLDGMVDGLLKKTLDITVRAISNAKIKKEDIDQVILAGGSTRMPKVQALLSEYFGAGIVKQNINPDECVAFGAALQAAMLSTHPRQSSCEKTKIVDVVPLSIGYERAGGSMEILINKNSSIPFSVTTYNTNVEHNQKAMSFTIYEGERLDCRKNNRLGQVNINITPAPPGECNVSLTLHIDSTGILTCTAEEEISGNRKDATIDFYTRGIKSDGEVREAIEDAENSKAEDEAFRAYSHRIEYLMEYCAAIMYNLAQKNLRRKRRYKHVYARCRQIYGNWFKDRFFYNRQSVEVIVEELTDKCDELLRLYEFQKMPLRDF